MELKLDPLSYSSATLLQNCTKKYYLYKVKKVSKDIDVEEDYNAFNVGKAFHKILEDCKHTRQPIKESLIEVCKTFSVEDEMPRIHAMVLKYFDLHEKSKMKLVAAEFQIVTDTFIGFIDAVMKTNDGRWWICDLKTAARLDESLTAKLKNDLQLNLYASFLVHIAKQYELDPILFAGCLYRVTTKSSLKLSPKNSYDVEVKRFYDSVKSYEVEIPAHLLNPKDAAEKHDKLYTLATGLFEGAIQPIENYSYCTSYFRPCEYWSQCHGKTHSECKNELIIKSSEDYDSV